MKDLIAKHKTLYGFLKPFLMLRSSVNVSPTNRLVHSYIYFDRKYIDGNIISNKNLLVHSHLKDFEIDNNISEDNKLFGVFFFDIKGGSGKCID